jgi:ribonuclease E
MSIEVVRKLMLAQEDSRVATVTIKVHEEVATYLNNQKRRVLSELEENGEMTVQIRGSESVYPEHLAMECFNGKGDQVTLDA